jgi:hypothetical protein
MSEEQNSKPSESDPVDHLTNVLKAVEEKGERLSEMGRTVTQSGQFMVDLARAAESVIKYAPPRNIEFLISDWEELDAQADQALNHLGGINFASINSIAGTAALSSGSSFDPAAFNSFTPQSKWTVAEESISNLRSVINRATDEQEVLALMKEFGLNRAPKGKKSASALFTTAHQSFKVPVSPDNPISTSLIPIRESIHICIDQLLKRRLTEEEAKGETAKIVSIGKQLKRDSIFLETAHSWSQQWYELLDRYLSTSKDQDISREEWQFRLQQATLFLMAFLGGLDPDKVNRRKQRSRT